MNYNETNQSLLDTRLLQLQTLDKEINVNLYKYKQSINCNRPKGFSQKQYCKYSRKKR